MIHLVKKPIVRKSLTTLAESARYDAVGLPSLLQRRISPLLVSVKGCGDKSFPLFRILQTNYCIYNCSYCELCKDNNIERRRIEPEVLAAGFIDYYRKKRIKGLFLSSGVFPTANHAQERMLASIEIIRNQYHYPGYIHAVVLPGADASFIKELGKYCNRLSVNLEVPAQNHLERLTAKKDFQKHLWRNLTNLAAYHKEHNLSHGITTQFVVGASNESDEEILDLAENLYREDGLTKTFYVGFQPIANTPLAQNKPCSPWRELRLYQADALLRRYGYQNKEIVFDPNGNLPLLKDPKLLWAEHHPGFFPLEINTASKEQLLRVPGIGAASVKRLLHSRKERTVTCLGQLKSFGIAADRARNYLTINGKMFPARPGKKAAVSAEQLLWEEF